MFYLDIGIPITNKWEFIFVYNRFISKSKSKIRTNYSNYEHNLEFSTFDFGFGKLY